MKNSCLPYILFLPLLFVLASCGGSVNGDLTLKSADQEHLGLLMALLDNRNITYEISEGMIRYKREVKSEIEKAEKALATAASVQYIDPDLREHFHSILYLENIEFLPLDSDSGSWTLWWAGSKDREMDILNQVMEYKITRQMEEDLDCESGSGEDPMNPSFIEDVFNQSSSIEAKNGTSK